MPSPPTVDNPVAITADHEVSIFDCGVMALNEYLRRHALTNHRNESARTYVACRGKTVVGYFTLAAGSVAPEMTPERIKKGLARHPVSVIVLARLAVDRGEQGRGFGRGLLRDALLRAAQAADIIGCRALLVHAKDENAKKFYCSFDFLPSPTNDLHLYLLMKDLRKAIGS